jgi:hypothetical protein
VTAIELSVINIRDLIERMEVEGVRGILSTFSCPRNSDIEDFLTKSAIDFSNRGIAQTHLVFAVVNGTVEPLGYFALSNKILTIDPANLSKATIRRIERHAVLDEGTGLHNIPTALIAQLGKNYDRSLDRLFEGTELLAIACGKVAEIQRELGGTLTYIECESSPRLVEFYTRNDFRAMGSGRPSSQENLIQMVKWL